MPRAAATRRLSRVIAALPGEPGPARPLEAVAGDLIALLPANLGLVPPLPEKVAAAVARPDARHWIGLGAIALLTAIGLLASMHSPPGPGPTARSALQAGHALSATAGPVPRPAKTSGAGPT